MNPLLQAPAIEVAELCKSFKARQHGRKVVLDVIDPTVPEGTVLALLGPNGAGKTTAVHILSTLLAADSGTVRIAGHDAEADAVRAVIGVTGQFSAVDTLLTGEENLLLMGDLRHYAKRAGRQRVAGLLAQFELTDAAKSPLATYSGGHGASAGFGHDADGKPPDHFLDEPTTGLDPRSRHTMR